MADLRLFQTRDGYSKVVSSGDTIFNLIGFAGLYFVLGVLFLFLAGRQINRGPDEELVAIPEQQSVHGAGKELVTARGGEASG